MKIRTLLAVLVLSVASLFGQPQTQFQSQVLNNTGDQITITNNLNSTNASFGYVIQGSPSTISLVINGCPSSGACTTLDTYTAVFNTTRTPTISSTYAFFTVTGSWTGGTSVSVTVNSTLSVPAASGSSPLTTKGDLYTFSTVNARLGAGTNGQCLTAQSGQTTGLLWASCGGGAPTGTGFVHITGGAQDAASKLVNLTASTDVAANQGTTTTLLHGNAAGQAAFTGVDLINDVLANQGTTTTVLHGNAAGQPSFGAIVLTTDVSGILPMANGGAANASTAGQGYFFGYTIYLPSATQTTAGDFQSANRVYVYQFVVPFQVTVRKVSINIGTGLAGSHVNVGLYNNSGSKLIDSGAFDTSVTGVLTATLGSPVVIPAGVYYQAQSSDSTSASLIPTTGPNPASISGPFLNASVSRIGRAANATSAGVLPATLGALTNDTFSFPLVTFFEP